MKNHVWVVEDWIDGRYRMSSAHETRAEARMYQAEVLRICPDAKTRIRKYVPEVAA